MHARVWRLAGPIILSNLSVPLLGAVDTAIMGRLPEAAYIGGVAVGAIIFTYIYWGFGFLRMGTTGLAAQAFGAEDSDELRAVLARGLVLAVGIGIAVIALQTVIAWAAIAVIEASDKVESLARTYFHIRVWGAPAALATYVMLGWLLAVRHAGRALVLMVFTNALNIALSLFFVIGLGWEIEGVAAGTLIAEWASAGLGWLLIAGPLGRAGGAWRRELIRHRGRILHMVRVNTDIFIRTSCLITAFAWFTAQGAGFGDLTLAANAVLLNFLLFMAYGLDGFAQAAEALIGGAIGARRRDELRAAVMVSSQWAFLTAAGFSLAYLLFGTGIVALLTTLPDVRATAATYLPWAIAAPLISVWAFQLDGIFIGATRTREMRNGMLLSLAVYLGAGYALLPVIGNHGLWLALMLFMVVRGGTLALWYPRIERSVAAS